MIISVIFIIASLILVFPLIYYYKKMKATRFNLKLYKAINLLDGNNTAESRYMCLALDSSGIIPESIKGFNRESFHKFIAKKYPELQDRLLKLTVFWIVIYDPDEEGLLTKVNKEVIKAKKEYLKTFLKKV